MQRGYDVESMLRLLSGNCTYRETHNALLDALDELEIIRLLYDFVWKEFSIGTLSGVYGGM